MLWKLQIYLINETGYYKNYGDCAHTEFKLTTLFMNNNNNNINSASNCNVNVVI